MTRRDQRRIPTLYHNNSIGSNEIFEAMNLYLLTWLRVKVYDYKLKVNWEYRNVYIVDKVRVRVFRGF